MNFAVSHISLALLLVVPLLHLSQAQQQLPQGRDKDQFRPLAPGSPVLKKRERLTCRFLFRSLDGTCTNPRGNKRKLWGSTNLAQYTYFTNLDSTTVKGSDLKSAREVSNILFASSPGIYDARGLNEMATFFGQFVDHTLVATPSDKSAPFPIPIPSDDPVFGNATLCSKFIAVPAKGELPFFRSTRVRVKEGSLQERPQNSLPSALDLASVYGPSEERNKALRGADGMLATSPGDFPPLNNAGFNNAPDSKNNQFFLTGDHRANEHPVLTALHTLFLREHNSLAAELKAALPGWTDDLIFETARKINCAQFQKIVFKDWFPSITGAQMPQYRRFTPGVDLTVSVEFSTAAFRVGHTMVGNHVSRLGPGNSPLPIMPFCEMFFNIASRFQTPGALETFVRGALGNRAEKVDVHVRDSLRNFLFENVAGEEGFDLVALNIQRGRDHALPPFSEIRRRFGLPPVTSFSDISSNLAIQSKLATAYGTADKVEAWAGMLAEDISSGSSLPPTILKIWQSEFKRLRDGDFFYYEQRGQFSGSLTAKIARVRDLFDTNVDTFKAIILRHTDITEEELPPKMFYTT